jgi:fatty-acyl-CoA synthase
VSTIVALLFTVYLSIALVLTLAPLWVALLVMPAGRRADRLVRQWSRFIIRVSLCPLRVSGLEHLDGSLPAVLVSNHRSYVDAVVLMAALPMEFHFVAYHGVLTWPVVGTAIRKAGHLTVDRGDRAARLACARAMTETLQRGGSLFVFPEGMASPSPDILPFRLGAFRAAVEAGRPIVPITLEGTGTLLPMSGRVLRPSPLTVTVHAPIVPVARSRVEMGRLRRQARLDIASGLSRSAPADASQNVRRATHSRSRESTTT